MTRLLCVVVLAACSGGSPPGSGSRSGGRSGATAQAHGSVVSDAGPRTADGPRSDGARDCDQLLAHAVALGVAERPDDQKLTADERARVQAQLRIAWTPKCEQMTTRGYDCALAAATLADLDACGG